VDVTGLQIFLDCYTNVLDESIKIKTHVLATVEIKENHKGENIEKEVIKVLDNYEILNKVTSFYTVTDGGADVLKSNKLLKSTYIYCINHFIHNCISQAISKNESLTNILDKYKRMSRFSKNLLRENMHLREEQNKRKIEKFKLATFVITRWNCIYKIFLRMLHNQSCLQALLIENSFPKVAQNLSSFDQWKIIDNVNYLLKFFDYIS